MDFEDMMVDNEDLKRYGIKIPKVIAPQQVAGIKATGVPTEPPKTVVQPKVYHKQKWFRSYQAMVEWKSQNGVSDAIMVKMKKPYRGYRYQLHYNAKYVTNKSKGIVG